MKLQHPHAPSITTEVPDADAERWLAAGWKKIPDPGSEPLAEAPQAKAPPAKRARPRKKATPRASRAKKGTSR